MQKAVPCNDLCCYSTGLLEIIRFLFLNLLWFPCAQWVWLQSPRFACSTSHKIRVSSTTLSSSIRISCGWAQNLNIGLFRYKLSFESIMEHLKVHLMIMIIFDLDARIHPSPVQCYSSTPWKQTNWPSGRPKVSFFRYNVDKLTFCKW